MVTITNKTIPRFYKDGGPNVSDEEIAARTAWKIIREMVPDHDIQDDLFQEAMLKWHKVREELVVRNIQPDSARKYMNKAMKWRINHLLSGSAPWTGGIPKRGYPDAMSTQKRHCRISIDGTAKSFNQDWLWDPTVDECMKQPSFTNRVEAEMLVTAAMGILDERERFVAYYHGGLQMSKKKLAVVMGLSGTHVGTIWRAAQSKMRGYLERRGYHATGFQESDERTEMGTVS